MPLTCCWKKFLASALPAGFETFAGMSSGALRMVTSSGGDPQVGVTQDGFEAHAHYRCVVHAKRAVEVPRMLGGYGGDEGLGDAGCHHGQGRRLGRRDVSEGGHDPPDRSEEADKGRRGAHRRQEGEAALRAGAAVGGAAAGRIRDAVGRRRTASLDGLLPEDEELSEWYGDAFSPARVRAARLLGDPCALGVPILDVAERNVVDAVEDGWRETVGRDLPAAAERRFLAK